MAKKDMENYQDIEALIDDYSLDINFSYPSREEAKEALLPKINEFLAQDSNALDKDSEPEFLLGEIRDFIEENIKLINQEKSDMALRIMKTNIKNNRAIERCQEEIDLIDDEMAKYIQMKEDKRPLRKLKK